MMVAVTLPNDLPTVAAKVIEVEAFQRASAITDKVERLEQAEAAAIVCERYIQPIREGVWNVLSLALQADTNLKPEATTEPGILDALISLVENPMGSPNLLRYVFGGKETDRIIISMRCVTPTGIQSETFPEGYLPFVFDCHFEHPNRQKSESFALLVHRDASLWRVQWPSLRAATLTSAEDILQWFLSVIADSDLRPVR